jgi:hypothetical protein
MAFPEHCCPFATLLFRHFVLYQNVTRILDVPLERSDRPSPRAAVRGFALGAIDGQVDITLVELVDVLRTTRGASFEPRTIWRFLDRHAVTEERHPPPGCSGPIMSTAQAHCLRLVIRMRHWPPARKR